MALISIYAMHFYQNGSIREQKTLIQAIPAIGDNGIKIINPKISEKVGNVESMDFSIQPNTTYFDAFIQMRSYIYVEYDGDLIFYGRVLTIQKGFYGEQQLKCEGAMAFFNDSYYPGEPQEKRPVRSIQAYIADVLANHNSQLNDPLRAVYPGEIPGNYSSAISSEQRIDNVSREFGENSWRQTKTVLDDLVSHYGGMLRIRHGSDNKLYLDWLKHYYRSAINSQSIEVGKNLIDVNSITEVNNIFTVIIPIGKSPASKESTEERKLYIDGMYFPVSRVTEFYSDAELNSGYHLASDYRNAVSRYGRIVKPQEFEDADTKEKLLQECAKWVKENYQGGIDEFTVSAVDLHLIGQNVQKILVGDRVRLRYPEGNDHHIVERILTCISVQYDLYNPENTQYTFGIPASSLSKGYSVNSKKTDKDTTEAMTPPSFGSYGPTEDEYTKWWKSVLSWLKSHKVWYNSVGKTPSSGQGPQPDDYFLRVYGQLDEDGNKQWRLFRPTYTSRKVEIHGQTVTQRVHRNVNDWARDSQHRPLVNWVIIKDSDLNRETLVKYKIFEYIQDEWGKNIAETMPVSDGKGFIGFLANSFINPLSGGLSLDITQSEMFEPIQDILDNPIGYVKNLIGDTLNIDLDNGFLGAFGSFIGGAGEHLKGIISAFGEHFNFGSILEDYSLDNVISFDVGDGSVDTKGDISTEQDVKFTDGDGNTVSARALKLQAVNTETKFGSLVEQYFEDPTDPTKFKIHAYEFTQSIEDYMGQGSKLVVARVDGDVVHIGSPYAGQVINQAMDHMTSVVGDVEYVTDSQGKKHWKIKSGAGIEIERNGTTYGLYDNGNLTAGVICEKVQNVSEADRVKARTGLGFYDQGTLTGGILVEKLNDNTITTHIRGDRIIVGNVDSQTAQTMKDKFGEVDGLIAQKATIADLNAAKARISTLETDNATIFGALSVVGGNIFTTGNINAGLSGENYIRGRSLKLVGASSSQGAQESTISYNEISDMIVKAEVSGNTLKLWKNGDPKTGDPSLTFSKATTLTIGWDSGTKSVKANASPQNVSKSYQVGTRFYSNQSGYCIQCTHAESSQTIELQNTSVYYKMALSGTTVQLQNTSGTQLSNTPSLNMASYLENKGTVTSNGTYTPSSGKIGISSITVNVPTSAPVNSIDIPTNQIAVSPNQPSHVTSPTKLTDLPNKIKNNKNTYVWFRVDAKDSSGTILKSKWYYCASA